MFCGSGCPGSSIRESEEIIKKDYYCNYSRAIFTYVAKKIPFLHEKKLIGKIIND
jgi:hypothetical protein